MRQLAACLALTTPLLLTGCAGFWGFLNDTNNPAPHMNQPLGNSENMREIQGKPVAIEPLVPEPGNVWPGKPPPTPTLEDLARQPMTAVPPLERGTPTPARSTLPTLAVPPVPPHLQPRPDVNFLGGPLSPTTGPVPSIQPVPAPPSGNEKGFVTVPNGNGTSTVIAPDGTITTIPTPPK